MPEERVRVVTPNVGGGFGPKGRLYPEEVVVAALALRLDRPCLWQATRHEDFQATYQGRGLVVDAELATRADGTLLGLRARLVQDAGAYPLTGSVLHMMTMRMTCGVYDIDNVGFTGVSTVTNAASVTAYRGAGRPEAAVAIERMVDRFAAEIDMDPAEVRRRNMMATFHEARTTGVGTAYDVGDYARSLELALDAAGYDDLALAKYPQAGAIQHVHHAGNSSGIVDGAALVLVGSERAGERHGLTPRARIRSPGPRPFV